ncbi:hypothetical protein [Salinicoccus roseus]|uniref:hypothetical protein n=1 Tax=Salinicoccus roseus TaxID=45670 RepID=UPI001EF3E37C|nr:hypothetical protein [Salinicoccus roseus]MCG7333567.1 hypothetical protein [Salinicoccus roseus]
MYLMHRISHENNASVKLLKEENLLPIGWSMLKGEKAERVLRNAKEMEQHEFRDDFVELGNEINNDWLTARRSNYLYRLKFGTKNKTFGNIYLMNPKVSLSPSYLYTSPKSMTMACPVI